MSITLIDKKPYHTLMTELHEVAGARVELDSVQVRLSKVFAETKVKVVKDVILNIDFRKQELSSESEKYKYDYLVIGSGAEPAFFGVEGVKENGFTIWSLPEALPLKAHVIEMFEKASVERNAEKRRDSTDIRCGRGRLYRNRNCWRAGQWKYRLCEEHEVSPKEVKIDGCRSNVQYTSYY